MHNRTDYFMYLILCAMILFVSLLSPSLSAHAATLSIDIGKDSSSIAAGRDFGFGYGMVGISATFITDAPWSYVQTAEGLSEPCEDFNAEDTKSCKSEGRFHDGDEWEIFGKLGYRLPLISRVYINAGSGISKRKVADLYLFCAGVTKDNDKDKECATARLFETWGTVQESYYLNFLGGVAIEMTHKLLLNIDYHTRKGVVGGLIWRF